MKDRPSSRAPGPLRPEVLSVAHLAVRLPLVVGDIRDRAECLLAAVATHATLVPLGPIQADHPLGEVHGFVTLRALWLVRAESLRVELRGLRGGLGLRLGNFILLLDARLQRLHGARPSRLVRHVLSEGERHLGSERRRGR